MATPALKHSGVIRPPEQADPCVDLTGSGGEFLGGWFNLRAGTVIVVDPNRAADPGTMGSAHLREKADSYPVVRPKLPPIDRSVRDLASRADRTLGNTQSNSLDIPWLRAMPKLDQLSTSIMELIPLIGAGIAHFTSETFKALLLEENSYQREFERAYSLLGTIHGPFASTKGRETEFALWRQHGREAAQFLVRRIKSEKNLETLNRVAEDLAVIGRGSIREIRAALLAIPSPEQAATLLTALGWINPDQADSQDQPQLIPIIERYLMRNSDAHVREAAAMATRILPRSVSTRMLAMAAAKETDAGVREAIEDELSEQEQR